MLTYFKNQPSLNPSPPDYKDLNQSSMNETEAASHKNLFKVNFEKSWWSLLMDPGGRGGMHENFEMPGKAEDPYLSTW